MTLPKCVICYKDSVDWNFESDSKIIKEKLSDQIRVVFILQNLLKIPSSLLQRYLLEGGNPCNWVSTCSRCTLLVNEALFVNSQINELRKKLHAFSEKVRNDVRKSCTSASGSRKSGKRKTKGEVRLQVTHAIRDFVVQNDPITDDSQQLEDRNVDGTDEASTSKDFSFRGIVIENVMTEEQLLWSPSSPDERDFLPDDYIKKEVEIDFEDFVWDGEGNPPSDVGSEVNDVELKDQEVSTGFAGITTRLSSQISRFKSSVKLVGTTSTREENNRPHKCDICGRGYIKSNSLRTHLLRSHKISNILKDKHGINCDLCSLVFPTNQALDSHKLEIHGLTRRGAIPRNRDQCEFCGQQFQKHKNLMHHRRTAHKIRVYQTNKSKVVNPTPWKCSEHLDFKVDRNQFPQESTEIPLESDVCNQLFQTKEALDCHKRETHGLTRRGAIPRNREQCEFCGQKFQKHKSLMHHRRTAHKIRVYRPIKSKTAPWKCSEHKDFKVERDQFQQTVQHKESTEIPLESDFCNQLFQTKEALDCHKREIHGLTRRGAIPRNRDQCEICGKTFQKHKSLMHHRRSAHKIRVYRPIKSRVPDSFPWKCCECKKGFQTEVEREQHELTVHNRGPTETEKPFHCQLCFKEYTLNSELGLHINDVHKNQETPKPFRCDKCRYSRKYATEEDLNRHIKRIHEGSSTPRSCTICGQGCQTQSGLRIHMQKHTNERLYMCDICSKTFTTNTYLNYHKTREHPNKDEPSLLKCTDCNKTLSNPNNLRVHKATVHEKKFKFICEICGKGCQYASTMKAHILHLHQNERPHQCTYENCNATFKMKAALNVHIRSKHTLERPYKCFVCNKGFTNSRDCKRHQVAIHSGKTPFECGICHKQFPIKDYLQIHMKSHNKHNPTQR